ncbi:hypothetical protein K9M79_05490 [Candidatus Woesearchaeota archaeon]|nr:hypothetical protein [Candidatus Woesearchaeota archaeon]
MSTQINLKLSNKMYNSAKKTTERLGYDSVQDFIRETLRRKLFEEVDGFNTYLASEKSLSAWNNKEEDKAWHHLQKET